MSKKNSICFVAGRSGGHLIPGLTLAKKIGEKDQNTQILFFTTNTQLDKKIIQSHTFINTWVQIALGNVPNKKMMYPLFLLKLATSFLKSLYILIKKRPKKVISMGGYISIPVCFAAFFLRIPIEVYELNASPGKAIKLLSNIAHKIHVCFSSATSYLPKKKCNVTQYPIRFAQEASSTKKRTKQFCPTKKTILILGGSQGSVAINTMMKQWIEKSKKYHDRFQIIHQTGNADNTNWKEFYKEFSFASIHFDFKNDIQTYYQTADIIICRSGAGTLFENIFFKKRFITIPLETLKTAHQLDNAKEIEKSYPELATVIRQAEVEKSVDTFYKTLHDHIGT